MSELATGWRIWLVSGVAGTAMVLLLFALFRIPEISPSHQRPADRPEPVAQVQLAWNGDTLLLEETALRDPTPLFLPTRWNASEDALAMNAPREPGGSFQDFPAQFIFAEAGLKLDLPPAVDVPSRAAESFGIGKSDRPFAGIGRTENELVPLPSRVGFIEVAATQDGRVILKQPVLDGLPLAEGSWQPLEFVIAVDPAGIVRPPVLAESSLVPAVDAYFQEYLMKTLHIGERLDPGFYRISIGP